MKIDSWHYNTFTEFAQAIQEAITIGDRDIVIDSWVEGFRGPAKFTFNTLANMAVLRDKA